MIFKTFIKLTKKSIHIGALPVFIFLIAYDISKFVIGSSIDCLCACESLVIVVFEDIHLYFPNPLTVFNISDKAVTSGYLIQHKSSCENLKGRCKQYQMKLKEKRMSYRKKTIDSKILHQIKLLHQEISVDCMRNKNKVQLCETDTLWICK